MFYEQIREVHVLGTRYLPKRSRGRHSSAVCAYWPAVGGRISLTCDQLRVGIIQYFVRHTVSLCSPDSHSQQSKTHLFAFVFWYQTHPRERWFHPRIRVLSPDMVMNGPATFLPISRTHGSCTLISERVKFDYGEDYVVVSVMLSNKFFV